MLRVHYYPSRLHPDLHPHSSHDATQSTARQPTRSIYSLFICILCLPQSASCARSLAPGTPLPPPGRPAAAAAAAAVHLPSAVWPRRTHASACPCAPSEVRLTSLSLPAAASGVRRIRPRPRRLPPPRTLLPSFGPSNHPAERRPPLLFAGGRSRTSIVRNRRRMACEVISPAAKAHVHTFHTQEAGHHGQLFMK